MQCGYRAVCALGAQIGCCVGVLLQLRTVNSCSCRFEQKRHEEEEEDSLAEKVRQTQVSALQLLYIFYAFAVNAALLINL